MDPIVSFIRKLIGIAVSTGLPFTTGVVSRVELVWNTTIGFFGKVRRGVIGIRNSIVGWISSVGKHALALLLTLKWIVQVAIPRAVTTAVGQVRTWASALVNAAVGKLAGALLDLQRWATKAVATVLSKLDAFALWVKSQIGAFLNEIKALKDRVFGVLASATRIADYIVDAMAHALARWLLANLTRLGQAFWGARTTITLRALHIIEGVLARII